MKELEYDSFSYNGEPVRFLTALDANMVNRGKRKDIVEENVIYHFAAIVVYGQDETGKMTCMLYNDNSVFFTPA